jgi:mannose-6-phosphate isomerase-like protein (cupin superfamily)
MTATKGNLSEKFASFHDHWSPRIIAELNGQELKAAKFQGEFIWHSHADADEMFIVHRGSFRMEFRDHMVTLAPGDFIVVPRGVEHRPVSDEEVEVLLFEPAGTLNTGDTRTERTVAQPVRI